MLFVAAWRPSGLARVLPRRAQCSRLIVSASGQQPRAKNNNISTQRLSILFISPVWPEHSSSAAGVRTQALVETFVSAGHRVSYFSPATPNAFAEELRAMGVGALQVPMNREAAFSAALSDCAPDVAIFDRFTSEEAFSFRLRECAPSCMRVLDLQDLHSLRRHRHALFRAGASPAVVLAARPDASDPDLVREISSIHRSDLTLVCSSHEYRLLTQQYGIDPLKLVAAPLFGAGGADSATESATGAADATATAISAAATANAGAPASATGGGGATPEAAGTGLPFAERTVCVALGNWRHEPNADAAEWLTREVWPRLRPQLPQGAELHLYGAYPNGRAFALNRPKEGVRMLGHAPSLQVLGAARLVLAPLRFGAGVKGKIADAWAWGTPVVTTQVGAEGMRGGDAPWLCDAAGSGDWAGLYQDLKDPKRYEGSSGGNLAEGSCRGDGLGGEGEDETDEAEWGGVCTSETAAEVADAAAALYCDERAWRRAAAAGRGLLARLFDRDRNLGAVARAVERRRAGLEEGRARDYMGAVLWQSGNRATEYFSRFIEAKEAMLSAQQQQPSPEG